jgi:hypothetical protein
MLLQIDNTLVGSVRAEVGPNIRMGGGGHLVARYAAEVMGDVCAASA